MNVYFLWKCIDPPLTGEIEIIEGSDWWIEGNQSFDIAHIEKMNDGFTCIVAKKMPEDWTGSHIVPLKQTIMKYKVVKENKTFRWDIVGEWNRIFVKNSSVKDLEDLPRLLQGSTSFRNSEINMN